MLNPPETVWGRACVLAGALAVLAAVNAAMIRHDIAQGYSMGLVACTMFRDTAPYMEEWIQFHAALGVERFYLYNHGSVDGYAGVLSPFVASGLATVIDWPVTSGTPGCLHPSEIPLDDGTEHKQAPCQRLAFDDCIGRARAARAEWIAVMDVDEFLYTTGGCRTNSLRDALVSMPQGVATVRVSGWALGTQGYERPMTPVVESYLRRNPVDGLVPSHPVLGFNDAIKSIGRAVHVGSSSIHHFSVRPSSLLALYSSSSSGVGKGPLGMFHYRHRSYESMITKVRRSGVHGQEYRADRDWWHSSFVDTEARDCSRAILPVLHPSRPPRNRHRSGQQVRRRGRGGVCVVIHHCNASDVGVRVRKAFWSVYRSRLASMVAVVDTVGAKEDLDYFSRHLPPVGGAHLVDQEASNGTACGGWEEEPPPRRVVHVPRAAWELLRSGDGTPPTEGVLPMPRGWQWWFIENSPSLFLQPAWGPFF